MSPANRAAGCGIAVPSVVPEMIGRTMQLAADLDIEVIPSPHPHVGKVSLVFFELAAISRFITAIANSLETVPTDRFKSDVYAGMCGIGPDPWTYCPFVVERYFVEEMIAIAAPSFFVAVIALHIPQKHAAQVQAALEKAVRVASVVTVTAEEFAAAGGASAFPLNT